VATVDANKVRLRILTNRRRFVVRLTRSQAMAVAVPGAAASSTPAAAREAKEVKATSRAAMAAASSRAADSGRPLDPFSIAPR
jgi:hypothetical protein